MKQYFKRKCLFPFISLGALVLLCLFLKIISWFIIPLTFGFLGAVARSLFKEYRSIERAEEAENEASIAEGIGEMEKRDELKRKAEDLRVKPKHWKDMLWTYAGNYLVILSLIYIILGYYLKYEQISCTIFSWAILFGFGFFVDNVFHRFVDIFKP